MEYLVTFSYGIMLTLKLGSNKMNGIQEYSTMNKVCTKMCSIYYLFEFREIWKFYRERKIILE